MNKCLKNTRIIQSKRQPPNLKKILTRAKFPPVHLNSKGQFKVTKCGRSNCALCQHIQESNHFNFNGKIFFVNENMSCDVKKVLYVITCTGCKEYYIGQTGDKLRTRRTIHAQQIRDPSTRQIPLSGHLDTCGKTDLKFLMFPFFKLKSENTSARLEKEKYFIKAFKPKLNSNN